MMLVDSAPERISVDRDHGPITPEQLVGLLDPNQLRRACRETLRLSEAGSFLAVGRKANGGALSRLMTHITSFFDFVLILVTAGALAVILTIMLYVTLQSRRSRN